MLQENLHKVNELWKKEGLNLVKPFLPFQVTRAFEKLSVSISKDVIDVYSILGGMEDCESDSTFFSFWGIEQILKENKPNSEFISFADFLIYSHFYYFKFENECISSIHIDGENGIEKIADSFEEFFENYLINPEEYYLFEREENKKEKKTIIQL